MLPADADNDLGDILQLLHAVCRNADIQPHPEQLLRLLQILHHFSASVDLGLQKERNIVGAVAGVALIAGLTVAFQCPHTGVDLLKSDLLIHMINMLGNGDLESVIQQGGKELIIKRTGIAVHKQNAVKVTAQLSVVGLETKSAGGDIVADLGSLAVEIRWEDKGVLLIGVVDGMKQPQRLPD